MHLNAPDTYIVEQTGLRTPELSGSDTVAAFVGYTETGPLMKPVLVRSLREYEKLFGQAETTPFDVVVHTPAGEAASYALASPPRLVYYMYHSIQLYFANGGAVCRVVSVGSHNDAIHVDQLLAGMALLQDEEVDLLLPSDAVRLPVDQYHRYCRAMLSQCAAAGDRFALIDLHQSDTMADFRNGLGSDFLHYGAAYSPFLHSLLQHRYTDASVSIAVAGAAPVDLTGMAVDAHVQGVRTLLKKYTVTLPPSAALAGVYAQADHRRGVWRTVADIRLQAVTGPVIRYSSLDQGPMNVDPETGKSINAIRSFRGRGTVLWGARTLDGNSDEWRYVSTRRLFIKIERRVKQIAAAAAGDANMSRTWNRLKTAIASYLDKLWKDGALSGTKAADAYFVQIGPDTGGSQTSLNIKVGLAVVRPAEYITVSFIL